MAAKVSHAITKTPFVNACPFSPTICSADKLVNKSDPAIVTPQGFFRQENKRQQIFH